MAKPGPRTNVELRDFPGMVEAVDQQDAPPGSTEAQVNVQSLKAGELTTRRGYRVVQFEGQTVAVS